MNYRMISYVMGQILKVVGLFMLLPIIVGFIYGEKHVIASFGIPFLITMAIGFGFTLSKPKLNTGLETRLRLAHWQRKLPSTTSSATWSSS